MVEDPNLDLDEDEGVVLAKEQKAVPEQITDEEHKVGDGKKIVVTYFKGRGRAESIRFALGGAGVDFENADITERKHMTDLMATGKLMVDQVPLLELPDGTPIV